MFVCSKGYVKLMYDSTTNSSRASLLKTLSIMLSLQRHSINDKLHVKATERQTNKSIIIKEDLLCGEQTKYLNSFPSINNTDLQSKYWLQYSDIDKGGLFNLIKLLSFDTEQHKYCLFASKMNLERKNH